jgi:hypothetical protein
LEARGFSRIVALALVVAAALTGSAQAAPSEKVAVLVVPATAAVFRSPEAAHGLLVVGEGATVSRRSARESLLHGELGNALVHDGFPGGKPRISISQRARRITFYVALPPPGGKHHNVVRYPIAVVGPGYDGLLTSTTTHLDGLISIADVAPSVLSLEAGKRPRIRSQASADPVAYLHRLDERLTRAHDSRTGATLVLVGLITVLGLLALVVRRALLGRAAFLAAPTCLVVAVALSAMGLTRPWQVLFVLAIASAALALAGGAVLRPGLPLAAGLAMVFVFLYAVMWAKPEWNSLAALGPRPDGGGRFYGVNNQESTLLLSPALVLAALAGPALPAVALLVVAGMAVSFIGAQADGLVVYLAGFLVLALHTRGERPGLMRAAAAVAVAVAAGLALVAIDAAFGGSSHITHAVGGGPGTLAGDLAHRIHLSAAFVVSRWNETLLFFLSLAGLVWLALQRPRLPVLDALLAALAVSLIVNDTPTDIAGLGVLSALVLWVWLGRSDERADALD